MALGGTATFDIGAGNGIQVEDDKISVIYGESANTSVVGNQTIEIAAGSNLAGGGVLTLGAGGTLTLETISNPIFSTSVTSPLLYLTNSGFTTVLQTTTLTADQTITLPDDTGEVCISTGNCAGLGGTIAGAGTPNRVAKFNTSSTISDSSINDLYSAVAMTIDASGNVGIGNTAPSYQLEVGSGAFGAGRLNLNGSQPFLRIQDTDAGFATNWLFQAFNNRLRLLNNDGATEPLSILTNGNVGIGTTAPLSNFHVSSATGTTGNILLDTYGGNGQVSIRRANGTPSSPTAVLSGEGIGAFGARGYGATGFSGGNRARILFSAAENWTDTAQGTFLDLQTTPTGSTTITSRLRITADGNVGIGTNTPSSFKLEIAGNIGPEADNTRNLGSAIRRWANIYATNITGAVTPTGFTPGSVVFAGTGGPLNTK